MHAIWKILTSLRLTVSLLILAIVLVFVGTVAQADEGLYGAQERYFKHWLVVGTTQFGFHMPWFVFPGGYTIGVGLVVNLVAAHIKRFKWAWSKLGIHLTHLGVVALLIGQLATDMLQVESRLRFEEGQSAQHLERYRSHELAFATDAADGKEEVVAIPEAMLKAGGEIAPPKLPFTILVQKTFVNAEVRQRAPAIDTGEPPATQGVGAQVTLTPMPEVKDMDRTNLPAGVIELREGGKSLGTWLVSPYLLAQTVEAGGKTFRLMLRDERAYLPYSLTLLQATHKKYAGSDLPKDFRSRVRIENPATKENREVEVSMNNPLRYAGLAFFQYQMTKDELSRAPGSSVLQVVRNPSWLVPYIGCIVVGAGLLWQFLFHLVGFITKRRAA